MAVYSLCGYGPKLRHILSFRIMDPEITSLQQLIERIRQLDPGKDPVELRALLEQIGPRSFGPLILIAGFTVLAPLIGDIPGVPTLMALLVLLVSGQILLGKSNLWLPRFMLNRSVGRDNLHRALDWLERPAGFVDRLFQPRLTMFSCGAGMYVIAAACACISVFMPFMEVIPFSANAAGLALAAFGLALVSRDGGLALFALGVTGLSFWLVVTQL